MKYYVTSDIHGFYNEFILALNNSGYDQSNPNHTLIVCGDLFDRGDYSDSVMDFLQHQERFIFIRGNHEDLMMQMLNRGYPAGHDYSNGTLNSLEQLANMSIEKANDFKQASNVCYDKIKSFFDTSINYYETQNYIFVHGWIPCHTDSLPNYYQKNRIMQYNPEWRFSRSTQWEDARWINGIEAANAGIIEPGKTIVCGHWHTSYGHSLQSGTPEWGTLAIFEPYYSNGIIAIDACTAYSGKVNVLTIEDEPL